MTNDEFRAVIEAAAEINDEAARSYGAINPYAGLDQRRRDYTAERALLDAASGIRALTPEQCGVKVE